MSKNLKWPALTGDKAVASRLNQPVRRALQVRLSRADFCSPCKSFLKIEFASQDITARFKLIHQPARIVKPQGYSVLRFSVAPPVQKLIESIENKLNLAA